MKTNHDYRAEALVLVGTLMSEAIRITGEGQFHVHVCYAGHVDAVTLNVYRASCSDCWQQDKNQKMTEEYRRLSPHFPDVRERALEHWELTLATLNHWHDELQKLSRVTAPLEKTA